MQMKDYRCRQCGYEVEYLDRGREDERLRVCEACAYMGTFKAITGEDLGPYECIVKQTSRVIPDDVPGGFWIENLDKVPRWFPSKSSFHTELASRGLTTEKGNQWRGSPGEGSDKPANGLSRWANPPQCLTQADEEARVRAWREHEEDLLASFSREIA